MLAQAFMHSIQQETAKHGLLAPQSISFALPTLVRLLRGALLPEFVTLASSASHDFSSFFAGDIR